VTRADGDWRSNIAHRVLRPGTAATEKGYDVSRFYTECDERDCTGGVGNPMTRPVKSLTEPVPQGETCLISEKASGDGVRADAVPVRSSRLRLEP